MKRWLTVYSRRSTSALEIPYTRSSLVSQELDLARQLSADAVGVGFDCCVEDGHAQDIIFLPQDNPPQV